MATTLGIIEGFYGPMWSWQERRRLVRALAPHGYGFYLYAPKADAFLRRRWREPHPAEVAAELADFARFCREEGLRFGVGLSPFEIFNRFDDEARAALARKLALLDRMGIDELAILFDDMRSDTPDLAHTQAEIVDWFGTTVQSDSSASALVIIQTIRCWTVCSGSARPITWRLWDANWTMRSISSGPAKRSVHGKFHRDT